MLNKKPMNKKMETWTLIIGIIGALAWTAPFLYEKFSPLKIRGKIYSTYGNFGTFDSRQNIESTQFVFKIGLLSINNDYNLKDFDLRVNFSKNGWKKAEIANIRNVIFTLDGLPQKLNVPKEDFLINKIILPKGTNISCYIFAFIPGHFDDKISEIELLFKSFNQRDMKLSLPTNELSEYKYLYDDKIWEPINAPLNYELKK